MKQIMNLMLVAFIALFSLKATAQSTEIIIKTSAQCKECKETLEAKVIDCKGVKFVELDMESKDLKVVYNSKKTNPELIRKYISDIGYNADDVAANPEAVEKLSPCCRPDGSHSHDE